MSTSKFYEMGKAAFAAGINAPVLDPAMLALMKPEVGSNVKALRAWGEGWTAANLAAPWGDR